MKERYFIRAVKYLLWLVVILALIVLVTSRGDFARNFEVLFMTTRGIFLIIAIFVISALYPLYGFVKRQVKADLSSERDREQIIKAFTVSGFVLDRQNDVEMVFKAEGIFKKFMLLWEDTITVTKIGDDKIVIDGIRKAVVNTEFRLTSYLRRAEDEN